MPKRKRKLFFSVLPVLVVLNFDFPVASAKNFTLQDECKRPLAERVFGNRFSAPIPDRFLTTNQKVEVEQTLFFRERTLAGKVILVKNPGTPWASKYKLVKNNPYTPQGDVRYPIFIFGKKLAAELGFGIRQRRDTVVEFEAPGAAMNMANTLLINAALTNYGLEPISYLTVPSGILDDTAGMELTLSANGDFDLFFAYADNLKEITPHEISFHLWATLLSKRILSRTANVSAHFRAFAKSLNGSSELSDKLKKEIIRRLYAMRMLEVDSGIGNLGAALAELRAEHPGMNYTQIKDLLFTEGTEENEKLAHMEEQISRLMHPTAQPIDVLSAQLRVILENTSASNALEIDEDQKAVLLTILENYRTFASTEEGLNLVFENLSSRMVLQKWLGGLDQRIEDILSALPKAKKI